MPVPKNRSRSMRKVFKKVPSGKVVLHFSRRKKTTRHHCAICKSKLQGVSSTPSASASQKTVSRRYGAHMCSPCTRKIVRYAALIEQGEIVLQDIDLVLKPYVQKEVERLLKVGKK